ncbi:hypothetical protein H4R34_005090 [Dimargaris verticillata]|uniref:Uncharacterized protein n=1 Tax=Dimargaris verticillata TaxID=2761393 RepID=A0A9W8AZG2_9FUNG|nr:hypothetical protein H4R34_005090 [Dimargaris verticillata]
MHALRCIRPASWWRRPNGHFRRYATERTTQELEAEIYKPWYQRNFQKPAYRAYFRELLILLVLGSLATNALWDRMAFEEFMEEADDKLATLQRRKALLEAQQRGDTPIGTKEHPSSHSSGPSPAPPRPVSII